MISRRNLIRLGLIAALVLPKFSEVKADIAIFRGVNNNLPVGFNWPTSLYPLNFAFNGTKFVTDFNPLYYARAALAGTQYFVNGSTGSDANTGLSLAQAVKSIWKATQLGNATSKPFVVFVASIAGGYPRENGFSNTSTTVPNTQPAAYIATGGVVETWAGSTLTWSLDTGSTYTAARTNVSQIIDVTNLDASGDYTLLSQVADEATVIATPNSWAQVAGNIFVHRIDNAAVTNSNTRALLKGTPQFVTDATTKDVYLGGSGFFCQGGAAGSFAMTAAATFNFIAVNCQASFAGDNLVNVNGWKLDYATGLVACINCIGSKNEADGFNIHWTPGGTPNIFGLFIDCIGRNNGRDTVQSCNGITWHDGVIGIVVNGEYYGNYGANVIPIDSCQMFCMGTYAHDSQGDVSHGGTTIPTDYQTQSTAKMWLLNCRSSVSTQSLVASNTSTILTKYFRQGAGQTQVQGAGATIGTYTS